MKSLSFIDKFILDNNISDEAAYAIYLFLENLLTEFESNAFCKLRRYIKKLDEESLSNTDNRPF